MSCRSEEALPEIEFEQKRKVEQPAQQVFGFEVLETARRGPEARRDADGDLRVLGKDAEFAETRALCLGQEFEADPDRARDRLGAIGLVARIEDDKALGVEPPVRAGDRHGQRLVRLDNPIAQEAVDDLQELRPFAEARGELG